MKKSKKVIILKRFSHCGSCKYSFFESDVLHDGSSMVCSRHHNKSITFDDSSCAHYVPFNDVMPPHKFAFYWLD